MSLHTHTPTLSVADARGLIARTVRYHRGTTGAVAQARLERVAYDAAGYARALWDARLESTGQGPNRTSSHSLSGRLLRTHSVDAGRQTALFDATGKLRSTWDSRGTIRRTAYDNQGRPVAAWEHCETEQRERCVERLTYAAGEPSEADLQRCGRLTVHHDSAGRWEAMAYGLLGAVTIEQRRFLANVVDNVDWSEAPAACEAALEPTAYTSHYAYDATGSRSILTDAAGHTRKWVRNVAGQLCAATLTWAGGTQQTTARAITYNAASQETTRHAGNGTEETRAYDPATGRLRRHSLQRGAATLQDREYSYDSVGHVVGIGDLALGGHRAGYIRDTSHACTYVYDSLDRLVEAGGLEMAGTALGPGLPDFQVPPDPNLLSAYTQTFSYDAAGNLTMLRHHSEDGHAYTHRYAVARGSNRVLPEREDGTLPDEAAIADSFDDRGNPLTLAPGQVLRWNGRNQLQQVTPVMRVDGASDGEVYVYDAGGQRVRKVRTRQAKAIEHLVEVRYLPGLELHIRTDRGEVMEIVLAEGAKGLRWIEGRPQGMSDESLRYGIGDHLGSVCMELDANGATISREAYYPYGGTAWWAGRNQLEADYKTIRYSGQESDATGLVYYGFRYYAPWQQRWLNPDPAGETDGLNLFAAFSNSPVSMKDVRGTVSVPFPIDDVTDEEVKGKVEAADYMGALAIAHKKGLHGAIATIHRWMETIMPGMDLSQQERFDNRMNNTLYKVDDPKSGLSLVLKKVQSPEVAQREALAYRVSERLGLHLVPPTLARRGNAMTQLFLKNFAVKRAQDIPPTAKVFYYLINQKDDNAGNRMWNEHRTVQLIDNESTFSEVESSEYRSIVEKTDMAKVFTDESWNTFKNIRSRDWREFFAGSADWMNANEINAFIHRFKHVKTSVQNQIDSGSAGFGQRRTAWQKLKGKRAA